MRIVLALLAFLPGLATAQTAGRNVCPPYTTPIKLNFTTESAPTSYNNNLNVTGIQNTIRQSGTIIAGMHQRALGLTASQTGLSLSGQTYAQPFKGGYCVYLRSVEGRFGFRRMDVLVASEFRPNSCEYKAVLDHENQHVAINRAAVRDYAPRVRQAIEAALQTLQPRFTRDAQTGSDEKLSALNDQAAPVMDEMERVMAQRNAAIDTSYNYSAISELCQDWDKGNVWPQNPAGKR
jgi:hypothetical protein